MLTPEQHLQRQLEHALREGFRDSSAAAELAGRLASAGRSHGHRLPHSCLGSFLALLQVTVHAMPCASRQGVQHDAHALNGSAKAGTIFRPEHRVKPDRNHVHKRQSATQVLWPLTGMPACALPACATYGQQGPALPICPQAQRVTGAAPAVALHSC